MEYKLRVQGWILDCLRDHCCFIGPHNHSVRQACLSVIEDYTIDFDTTNSPKYCIAYAIVEREEFISSLDRLKKKVINQIEDAKKALKNSKKKDDDAEDNDE